MKPCPRSLRAACAAVVVALALASCATTKSATVRQFTAAPLYGMIYDKSNRPVSGVSVAVDGKRVAQSDVNGRFVVPRLSRGAHEIVATKSGFETLRTRLDFLSETQVLYLQILSQSELLSSAETQLSRRNWARARALLGRAGKVDPTNPVYLYTLAILDYRTKKMTDAVRELNALLSSGERAPSVYLLLADIFQYSLGKPERAVADLKEYLAQKGDDAVSRRLQRLEESLSSSQSQANSEK